MTAQSEPHDYDSYDTNKRPYDTEHGTGVDKGKGQLQDPVSDDDARIAQLRADMLMAHRLQEELDRLHNRMGTSYEGYPATGPSNIAQNDVWNVPNSDQWDGPIRASSQMPNTVNCIVF